MSTIQLIKEIKPQYFTFNYIHQISKRFSVRQRQARKRHNKSFAFLDRFIPQSQEYLPAEHLEYLMGWDEVEDHIPPQLPKQLPQKEIEMEMEDIQYLTTFPEFSILSSSEPRFVELHMHLEGSMNADTLWSLYKYKKDNNDLNGLYSFDTIYDLLSYIQSPLSSTKNQSDLFYDKYRILCSILCGNYKGIEQLSYELCKRQYENGVYYTEVRFNPYLLCKSFNINMNSGIALNEFEEIVTFNTFNENEINEELNIVINSVISGLKKGCAEYNIKIYPILTCLRYRPDLSDKIIDLAFKYRDLANNECHIVGIDLFGGNELQYHSRFHERIYDKCKKLNIFKTVHCGDSFDMRGLGLENAIHQLSPNRIAYCIASKMPKHILHRIYQRQLHLELTPLSNMYQFPHVYNNNNIDIRNEYNINDFIYWINNNSANYSFSTDFPILFDSQNMTYLNEINRCMQEYNIGNWEIANTVLNAARASFLNDHDKNVLLMNLRQRWKKIAPNLNEHNFYEEFKDETWENADLLNLHLLKPSQSQFT